MLLPFIYLWQWFCCCRLRTFFINIITLSSVQWIDTWEQVHFFAVFSPSNKCNVGWMKRLRVQFSFRLRWKFPLSSAFIFINSFIGIIITIVLALLSLFSFITGWQQWNTAGNITRSLRPVSHVALMRLEKLILAKGGRIHNAMCWIYKEDEIFVVLCFVLPTQPNLSTRSQE